MITADADADSDAEPDADADAEPNPDIFFWILMLERLGSVLRGHRMKTKKNATLIRAFLV